MQLSKGLGRLGRRWGLTLCLVVALVVTACGTGTESAPEVMEAPVEEAAPEGVTEAPAEDPGAGLPRLMGAATVEMEINGDRVVIELDGDHAPVTAGSFVDLVQRQVYDGLVFHRVVREPEPFVVQGGDPQSGDPEVPEAAWGTGGFIDPDTQERRVVPLEIQPEGAEAPLYGQTFEMAGVTAPPILRHSRGAIAMARSQVPDSASSQFYFTLADLPFLDGSYAVFGYVTEGMEVIDAIQQGDRITSARVTAGADNLQPAD